MRRILPLLAITVALLLAGLWMRGQSGSVSPAQATASAGQDTTLPPPSPRGTAAANGGEPLQEALAAGGAVDALHAYLALLPGPDRAAADGYWAGGIPDEGERVLRELAGLGSMRVDTDRPVVLDAGRPPAAYEVPVRLRLATAQGLVRLRGHYRLRATDGAHGWKITSAQLERAAD